jgi:hypothetical protein
LQASGKAVHFKVDKGQTDSSAQLDLELFAEQNSSG